MELAVSVLVYVAVKVYGKHTHLIASKECYPNFSEYF